MFAPSQRTALLALTVSVLAGSTAGRAQLQPGSAVVIAPGHGGLPLSTQAEAGFGTSLAIADFDGDGRQDLAVGEPARSSSAVASGAVHVHYFQNPGGLAAGLTAGQFWRQGHAGVPSAPEANDFWGYSLAAGDFDGDGYADLAIGAPFESVGAVERAGAVTVLRGSAARLTAAGVQTLHQDANDVVGTPLPGSATAHAFFGATLASGDFDDDGFDDLAIGIPQGVVPFSAVGFPGTVQVLYGSATGLRVRPGGGSGLLSAGTYGWALAPEDLFGRALATADFDQDGFDDLAIGLPGRDQAGQQDVGAIVVARGGGNGLGAAKLAIQSLGIAVAAKAGASHGASLAAGDFDGDGFPDLAAGRPGQETEDGAILSGAVHLYWGAAHALETGAPGKTLALSAPTSMREMGIRLAAGDFDGDGAADLIVTGQSDQLASDAGAIAYFPGGKLGPTNGDHELWWQGSGGLPGTPGVEEFFGFALATGDLDHDGTDDLVVSSLGDEVGGDLTGSVTFIPGRQPTCIPTPDSHCLQDGRFRVSVDWETKAGATGVGKVVADAGFEELSGSSDSGLFWFFAPANWELMVKVLDGCGTNQRFWVFAAATTNVGYTLRVEDTATGAVREFTNPLGASAQALADTDAFATCAAGGGTSASLAQGTDEVELGERLRAELASLETTVASAAGATGTCQPGPQTLCLGNGRFVVSANWRTKAASGSARLVPVDSADSGLFWFFKEENWELLVKVLDGCALNGHFWVFSAATTNVEYELRVRDTWTGANKVYRNPQGVLAAAVTDTSAFAGCGATAP
jgi:hypothetical protein